MLGIPMLYGWIAGAVLLIATAGGSFYEGINVEADHRDAQQVKLVQTQLTQFTIDAGRLNADSQALETKLGELHVVNQIVTQQVDKIITRDIYRNVCLDDDGLRLVANSFAAKASADPSGSDSRVRITIPASGRNGSNDSTNAGGSGAPVQ